MRVLVCGGRNFNDGPLLLKTLGQLNRNTPITVLIHGDAKGADTLAGAWAKWVRIPVSKYPANWKCLGAKAGPKRNQQMIDEGKPDLVVAFPGGKGTEDMVRRAKKAGINVIEVTS